MTIRVANLMERPVFYWDHRLLASHLFEGLPPGQLPVVGKSGRALCLSFPLDHVRLEYGLEGPLAWVIGHYSRVGLPVAKNNIVLSNGPFDWDLRPRCQWTDVFCVGDENCSDLSLVETVKGLNNKNEFIKLCRKEGWPIPDTWTSEDEWEYRWSLPPRLQFPVVVKAAVSAGGKDVFVCRNDEELQRSISILTASQRQFQVQEFLAGADFYSIQCRKSVAQVPKLEVTKQIMFGNSYVGTSSEVPDEVTSQLLSLTQPFFSCLEYITESGVEVFGLDFAVTKDGRMLLIECNPRYTAAIYPAVVAERLGHTVWEYRYFEVGHNDLSKVLPPGLEYNPTTKKGAVIVDWGSILRGEVGILFLGSSAQCSAMINQVRDFV